MGCFGFVKATVENTPRFGVLAIAEQHLHGIKTFTFVLTLHPSSKQAGDGQAGNGRSIHRHTQQIKASRMEEDAGTFMVTVLVFPSKCYAQETQEMVKPLPAARTRSLNPLFCFPHTQL